MNPRLRFFFPIVLATLLFPSRSLGQRMIKDSFEFNVLTTLDKLLQKAMNPATRAMDLAGEPTKLRWNGTFAYRPKIQMPMGTGSDYQRYHVNWDAGTMWWQWSCVVVYSRKPGSADYIKAAHRKLDSILKRQEPEWKKLTSAKRDFSFDHGVRESDTLNAVYLHVNLTMPVETTEEHLADSIMAVYRPLLYSLSTVNEYTDKLDDAFEAEYISKEMATAKCLPVFKELLNKDINLAFAFTMLDRVDVMKFIDQMDASQRSQINAIAQKVVDDYYAKTRPKTSQDEEEALKEYQRKEEEKKAAKKPSTPCEEAIAAAPFRERQYFKVKYNYGKIMSYDCYKHTYYVIIYDKGQDRVLRETVPEATARENYSATREVPFTICNQCGGKGTWMEYDWVQMNGYSGHYARTNRQSRVSCGVCWGWGILK